jgi:hypothetical protein
MNSLPIQQPVPTIKKSNKIWIIVVIILLVLCCLCSLQNSDKDISINFGNNSSQAENSAVSPTEESQEKSSQTSPKSAEATQKPLIQLPDLSGVKLGDEVRIENCGFSFTKVPDFQYNSNEMEGWGFCSSPSMIAPGGDNKVGPIIIMIDDAGENGQTKYDEMVEKYKNDDTVISQKPTKIGGVNGISVVGETKSGNTTIKSLTVFALVTPTQFFQIIALAPSEKWADLVPYYESVMKSVSFFEPVQSSAPVIKSGEEIRSEEGGYSFKTNPDYKLTLDSIVPGIIPMWDKDKDILKCINEGPFISLEGSSKTTMSIEETAKFNIDNFMIKQKKKGSTISNERQASSLIAGLEGKAYDIDYVVPDIGKIKFRMILVEVNPKQRFVIQCFSPVDRWDKTLADCEAVTKSVAFFDIKPK